MLFFFFLFLLQGILSVCTFCYLSTFYHAACSVHFSLHYSDKECFERAGNTFCKSQQYFDLILNATDLLLFYFPSSLIHELCRWFLLWRVGVGCEFQKIRILEVQRILCQTPEKNQWAKKRHSSVFFHKTCRLYTADAADD